MILANGESVPMDFKFGVLEIPRNHNGANHYPNGQASDVSIDLVPYGLTGRPDVEDGTLSLEKVNQTLKILHGLGYAVELSDLLEVSSQLRQADAETRPAVSRKHRRHIARQLGIVMTPLLAADRVLIHH